MDSRCESFTARVLQQRPLEPKLPRTDETDALLEAAGLETLEYTTRWNHYRIRVTERDIKLHTDLLKQLISEARNRREG